MIGPTRSQTGMRRVALTIAFAAWTAVVAAANQTAVQPLYQILLTDGAVPQDALHGELERGSAGAAMTMDVARPHSVFQAVLVRLAERAR